MITVHTRPEIVGYLAYGAFLPVCCAVLGGLVAAALGELAGWWDQ